MNFNKNVLIYYSKTSYNLLYQRPHQIMKNFDISWSKIFITNEPMREYYEDINLHVWVYGKRRLIFKNITNDNNVVIYYTDSRLHDEIIDFQKQFSQTKILFDLIDAPIDEFKIWLPKLNLAVNNADFVIYSHPKLLEYLNAIDPNKQYNYISNACEYNYFSKAQNRIYPKPIDMPNQNENQNENHTDKLILGYYGAFSHWIDWDLVKKFADSDKYHLVMIGGIDGVSDYNIRFEHPNITWLSHKPYDQLVNYLSWFDVCFLPFKKTKLNEYVNPCKLWEYKASNKPILKFNINIDDSELITYEQVCEKLKNIIDF